jgi:hypothetical protein
MNHAMKAFRRMFDISHKLIREETGIPANTWVSYELGRRRLTDQAAKRLSEATGIATKCFKNGASQKLVNIRGEPYTRDDFVLCKKSREPEGGWDNSINRGTTYATLLVSWYFLDAINAETLSTGVGLGRFQDDLKRFVKKELSRIPSLQERISRRQKSSKLNRERLLKWLQEWQTEFRDLFEMQ